MGMIILPTPILAAGPSSGFVTEDVSYWQTFTLGHNLIPVEQLWYTQRSIHSNAASRVRVPDYTKLFKPRANKSAFYAGDDFVVPDDQPDQNGTSDDGEWIDDGSPLLATRAAFSVPNEEAYHVLGYEDHDAGTELEEILTSIPERNDSAQHMILL